ncbi:hypothetical protein GYMLUDRAFT_285314 [Collybiopsis luxurians FD-317 M1]|nr:hypothetical protein GYMLUDRAFT_285314 [Collybiopsis luxurians FD-317 M1]
MVYDLNLERESPVSHHELPSPLRLRPQLVRRNEWQWEAGGRFSVNNYSNMASTQRRWTLAMAMTSDELTDEVFVEEVERIRQNSLRPFDELEQNRNRSIEGAGGFRGWEFGYLDPDSEDDSDEDEGYDDTETYEGEFPGRERSMPDLGRPMSDEGTNETLPRRSTSVMQMSKLSVFLLLIPVSFFCAVSTASSHPNSGLNPDPTKAWSSALHALLITRDLLRTERNYLDQLKLLLSSSPCEMTPAAQAFAETSFLWGAPESSMSSSGAASTSGLLNLVTTDSLKSNSGTIPWPDYPSPSLMHAYLLSLVALSLSLLTEWEKDPTVVSMGQIFVAKEEEIERVFVGWCGAVAGWMVGQKTKRGKKYKSTGGAVGEKRSRKLSKSKFSTPTSSISHLNLSTLTPSATSPPVSATASSLSTPPISFISTANTEAGGRPVVHSSNTGVATAKWRKSMSNIPDLRFDPQRSDSCTDVTSVTVEFPKSIGSKPGCFADSQSSSLSMPSTEVTRVRRASTMLSMNMNLPDVRKDQEGRGRRDLSYTELPRSRSQGVLPVMISAKSRFSKLSYAQTGAGFNREPSFGLIDGNGRKIHSVRELGILPVQRVTRYALLFRDLLKCTPQTSPSRAILEQASDAAIRIAAKCDRAQGNAKFFFSNSVVGSDKTPN